MTTNGHLVTLTVELEHIKRRLESLQRYNIQLQRIVMELDNENNKMTKRLVEVLEENIKLRSVHEQTTR